MGDKRDPPAPALRRRLDRPWRWAFVVYVVALTLGTHWPQLALAAEVPLTDKTIHFLAFGALAWLLSRTRWVGLLGLLAIAVAWSIADEVTQGLPGVNRQVGWPDATANVLGVLVATTFVWALAPVGGAANRRRLALDAFAFDTLFARRGTWAIFTALTLAAAVPIAVVWRRLETEVVTRVIVVTAGAWLAACLATLLVRWRTARAEVCRRRPCFACGTPAGPLPDTAAAVACGACGASIHPEQWHVPPVPPAATRLRLAAAPTLAVVVAVVVLFAALRLVRPLYAALIADAATQAAAASTVRFLATLRPTLALTIDLAILLVLLAGATRLYRLRLARYYDRTVRCASCGHDLRGTPTTTKGTGRCGECGHPFTGD